MADKLKKVEDAIKHATKWLASEFKYFTSLETDLKELKQALYGKRWEKGQAVKQIKGAMRDFRSVARSERRFNPDLEKIKEFQFSAVYRLPPEFLSQFLQGSVAEVESRLQEAQEEIKAIKKRLDIEGNHLIFAASFFKGKLKEQLVQVETLIEEDEKIRKSRQEWEITDKEEADLLAIENKLKGQVDELLGTLLKAEEWLSALSSDLTKAGKIFNRYQFSAEITPQAIETITASQMKDLNSTTNLHAYQRALTFLNSFLHPDPWAELSEGSKVEVKRQIGVVIYRANKLHNGALLEILIYAGEIYYKNGLVEEAKRIWKKGADVLAERNYKEGAAKCYEKAEMWKEAAENWLKSYVFDKNKNAAECYNKLGEKGYYKVGMIYMKVANQSLKENNWERAHSLFSEAADVFEKGGYFDMAGKCYEIYANAFVVQRKGQRYEYVDWSTARTDFIQAFIFYKKAGNHAKMNEILPKIRTAEECDTKSSIDQRNFFIKHSTDGNITSVRHNYFDPNKPSFI